MNKNYNNELEKGRKLNYNPFFKTNLTDNKNIISHENDSTSNINNYKGKLSCYWYNIILGYSAKPFDEKIKNYSYSKNGKYEGRKYYTTHKDNYYHYNKHTSRSHSKRKSISQRNKTSYKQYVKSKSKLSVLSGKAKSSYHSYDNSSTGSTKSEEGHYEYKIGEVIDGKYKVSNK